MKPANRRSFLRIAGTTLGVGALYRVAPLDGATPEITAFADHLGRQNGERVKPFSIIQLSDTHVGFSGAANPLGTAAFERAVQVINALPERPDLALFTGDLTHDSEKPGEHAERMKIFQKICGELKVPMIKFVPGEHDAGLDGGELYRNVFGPTNYSFDHKGVHFVALDNVSRAKPEVGAEQLAWLKKDLSRFPVTAPIIVFTHRPLFDLRPEWEWFTSDGDQVLNVLDRFQNVSVLYGHIHTDHDHEEGHIHHHGARSLIFAFPKPDADAKKQLPFDKDKPFQNLGVRLVRSGAPATVSEIELTVRQYDQTNGINQILKPGDFE